jgi:hypothetical protein
MVAPHLIVEWFDRPAQGLISGNGRGFRPSFVPNWSQKRVLRTTFRSTTIECGATDSMTGKSKRELLTTLRPS